MKPGIILASIISLFLTPALTLSLTLSCTASPALATPLKGGVEHSEYLPPVESDLRVGAKYNDQMLPKTSFANEWYMIPAWFSGTWHKEQERGLRAFNYRFNEWDNTQTTYKCKTDYTRGDQEDRAGGIWVYQNVPAKHIVEADNYYAVNSIRKSELVDVSASSLTKRTNWVEVRVNKADKRIDKITQAQSLTVSTFIKPGRIKSFSSTKIFGPDGKPLMYQETESFLTRTTQFSPNDTQDSTDLKTLFKQYLLSHGKQDLAL